MNKREEDRNLKTFREALILIKDIGFDYDGKNSVEGLKLLIDELVDIVKKALRDGGTK